MSAQTSIQIRSAFPLIVATAMLVGGLNTTPRGLQASEAAYSCFGGP